MTSSAVSSASLTAAHFTLIFSTGDVHRLPLEDAQHCTTLAWLIPSNTLSCILPPTCTAASIRIVLRLLHLLSHHPFPGYTERGQQEGEVPAVFVAAVAGLGREEMMDCATTCSVLRVHPLHLTRLWDARGAVLREEERAAGRGDREEQLFPARQLQQARQTEIHKPQLDISLPTHIDPAATAAAAAAPSAAMAGTEQMFTFTSAAGTSHTVPSAIASLIPAAKAHTAAGTFTMELPDCSDTTLRTVVDFLTLLTRTPLLVHHGPYSATSPPALQPDCYAALFDGLRWDDGSIMRASMALGLDTLTQAAMVATAEGMARMMATESGRQAMMASFEGSEGITVHADVSRRAAM